LGDVCHVVRGGEEAGSFGCGACRDEADGGDAAGVVPMMATPATGRLVAMDSRAWAFTDGIARLIRLRDRVCRTPWCDAPVRHVYHVQAHQDGGPTNETNGQGLCESCNHAKQAAGWHSRIRPGRRHEMETTTPTGHTYRSRAPATWPAAPPLATTGSTSLFGALLRFAA